MHPVSVLYTSPALVCIAVEQLTDTEPLTVNAFADNSLDDKLSVITIFAPQQRQERLPRNALLEIASCINGGPAGSYGAASFSKRS